MAPRRKVYTFDGVVDALGGNKAVAELLEVTPSMVSHLRRAGRFPARAMPRIEAELARKGATAPTSLFDFDPPKTFHEPDNGKRNKRA